MLVRCKNCGCQISDKATKCVTCGYDCSNPVSYESTSVTSASPASNSKTEQMLIGVASALAIIMCFVSFVPKHESTYTRNRSENRNSYNSTSPVATTTVYTREGAALQEAYAYLNLNKGWSYQGLVDQLVYTGYTQSEAEYAASHCGANWKEQAVISARNYYKLAGLSRDRLISQLEYEGFSYEEAVYGVDHK